MDMAEEPQKLAGDGEWVTRAACADTDLVLWYGPPEPDEPGGYPEPRDQRDWRERRALQICDSCPVRKQCLAEELRLPMTHQWGVRGGMTDRDRRALLRLPSRSDGTAPRFPAAS